MVRETNQDVFFASYGEDMAIAIVCDGMGGARAGNIASKIACDILVDEIQRRRKPGASLFELEKDIADAIEIANTVVFEMANSNNNYFGMGTTMVGVIANEHEALVFHIGDSRAYLLSDSKLSRITRDHSIVEYYLSQGKITEEEAKKHPQRNLITRVLGPDKEVEPEFIRLEVNKGDWIMLCSDGLIDMVDDETIEKILTKDKSGHAACKRLINAANTRGGLDNVTVAIVSI